MTDEMAGTVAFDIRGRFDLAAGIRFLEDFAPAASSGPRERGTLAIAFPAAPSWRPAAVRLRQESDGGNTVVARIDAPPGDVAAVAAHARRIVSLDVDGTGFDLIDDPHVAALRDERPGLRPVLFHSPYEAACWAVIGHRIRITQAAAVKQRIAERLGTKIGGLTSFPAPARLAEADELADIPGLPPVKVERLHAIARAALDGVLDADRLRAMEATEALVELQRLPGIGLFSAELILIRGAGHPDVFPTTEGRLHDEMAHVYGIAEPSVTRLATVAQAWRPYRSWVAFLMRTRREEETGEIRVGRRVTR